MWTGWANKREVTKIIAAMVAGDELEPIARQHDARIRTVRDLMETWMAAQERRADISKKTVEVSRFAARHVVGELAETALDRVDLVAMERYRDVRIRSGAATRTVELEINVFRRAWRWGREVGVCPDRVPPRPRLRLRPARDKHTPSPDDVAAVINELQGWPQIAVQVIAVTGARMGEVADVRWADVDLRRALIRFDGKTGVREVPLTDHVLPILAGWHREVRGARVLGVQPSTARTSISQRYLPVACDKVGVRRFTPHGVRRMVVDRLYSAGVDVGTVAALLGQSPKVALKYYRQSTSIQRRDAVRHLDMAPLTAVRSIA